MTERGNTLSIGDDPRNLPGPRWRAVSSNFPFPAPRKRSSCPAGSHSSRVLFRLGFHCLVSSSTGRSALWQLWWGIVLFSVDGWRQLKVMTRNGRHMETWTGVQFEACVFCLFQDCIAACTLSIRRVQSPPTAYTGARSHVLRRQTDSTLPVGRGVVPFAIKHHRPNQINLSRQTISPSSSPSDDPQPSTLRPVTFQLSPGASNQIETPPSCAAGGMRRKSSSKELAAA